MKIESDAFIGLVTINVQTRSEGCSATKVFQNDSIEVYFGGLYTQVTLLDLGIRIIMNPDKGEWRDPDWARARAMSVIVENAPNVMIELAKLHREIGRKEGKQELRSALKNLLQV